MPRWLIPRSAPARIGWQILLLVLLGAVTYWLTSWLASDLGSVAIPPP